MTANATCPHTQQLAALVDRTLPDDLQTELEGHVDKCEICLRSLRDLVYDDVALAFLAEAPLPPDAIQRMKSNRQCDNMLAEFSITVGSLDFLDRSEDPNSIGRLGPYEISEVIGRGGMGIVLKGHDTKLNRVVAVKILAPELASNVTARKRFLRESQAAAAVGHPHVVTIHAVDEDRLPYFVMEYVNGQSLREKIDREGALQLKQLLRIAAQAATGLAAAHEQGLIHRDIKPANILLENGVERVKLTDFGLARAADDAAITRTGEVAGTPPMSLD